MPQLPNKLRRPNPRQRRGALRSDDPIFILELPERVLPARRHQDPLERLPRQEESRREGMTEALRSPPLREAAKEVAELVGGREPHPVVREIAVDRDERDSSVIPREALKRLDAASPTFSSLS